MDNIFSVTSTTRCSGFGGRTHLQTQHSHCFEAIKYEQDVIDSFQTSIITVQAYLIFVTGTTGGACVKKFLSVVNFSRLGEKNANIFDFFRDIFSVFGAFSRFYGCKIWFLKILPV